MQSFRGSKRSTRKRSRLDLVRIARDCGSRPYWSKAMKSADPIVEIVITNHNYGDYVRDAIESALAQTRQAVS